MADFENDAADWVAEEVAELAQREANLERLKPRIAELERAGLYADAHRTRELLAEATESIGFTRMRLQRELADGTLPYPLPATRYPLPATRYPLPATRYRYPLTRYPLPATRYPLPATRYPLPATRYPLPATRYPLPATRYPR